MPVTYHPDVVQGSEEWLAMRCGLLTASEVKLILTPTLKIAANDKTRAHVWELAAQRITGYVEPQYISDDMLRGYEDEIRARDLYSRMYAPVTEVGFVTSDDHGVTLGYSPDGLVGDDGLIEIKSRRQKYQVETIVSGEVPAEHVLQCQTGLLITGRAWLDYVSYSGGLPMCRVRVYPDERVQEAIIEAALDFDAKVRATVGAFEVLTVDRHAFPPTERIVEQEMFMGGDAE
jgi:predicted phage-related endonuclease